MADEAAGGGGPFSNIAQLPYANPEAKDREVDISGGAGGGGDGSLEITLKDYIDAQDEKTRAQNDARFVRIESTLGAMKFPSIWQIGGVIVAGIGIAFGILAFASDRFDGGLSARSVMDPIIEAQKKRDTGQDKKLDKILTVVEQIRDKPQGRPSQGKN